MIKLENVTKAYPTGNTALADVSFNIERGEFVFLIGPSGSGKTTLFRLLIRDTVPTTGSIRIGDWDLVTLPHKKVHNLRKNIGMVFQDLKLLRDRTIYENIMFPLEVGNMDTKEAKERVDMIIDRVGIADHVNKFPIQLSGGELQRAAIARALAFNPEILLADEPTGNLDSTTSWEIMKLLQDINAGGTTIIMATHSADIVNSLKKRTLVLEKGTLTRDDARESSKHDDSVGLEKDNIVEETKE
ncbi:MAG: ATP-binding cassette domain-containing protein [Candidatus Levybacteria bacterium]|nr:ATP-binding cassette domain-containing protein [Candidatus Levybacteria bacterium]